MSVQTAFFFIYYATNHITNNNATFENDTIQPL